MIRWFGERGKLFNVHFRNIRGGKLASWRPSPTRATWTCGSRCRLYAEVGYHYMLMPDHVPEIAGRASEEAAFAFSYGYIAALLQMVAETHPGSVETVTPA